MLMNFIKGENKWENVQIRIVTVKTASVVTTVLAGPIAAVKAVAIAATNNSSKFC